MPTIAVRVPVLKKFTYHGRVCPVGSFVTLPPVVAAIYARQGIVSLTRSVAVAAETPAPDPEVPARRRGRYRRRDLRAEKP